MVRDGHTGLTHIGVGAVDVHLVEACLSHKHILDRGFTNARCASKVYRIVASLGYQGHSLREVDTAGEREFLRRHLIS